MPAAAGAVVGNATAVNFKKLYDREIPSWVAGRIRARGKEITVWVFVMPTGKVASDSTRLDPATTWVVANNGAHGNCARSVGPVPPDGPAPLAML